MKKQSFKPMEKINEIKSYTVNEALVKFMIDWLQIHKKRDKLLKEGTELSPEDKKKLRETDRMKVYVIDNIIFPAIANLTYFFEAIASSSRAHAAFRDEIEEMLDPRNAKSVSSRGGSSRFESMAFRNNTLARLLSAMLAFNVNNYPRGEFVTDFRIGLMYQMQKIIGDKIDDIILHDYGYNQIWRSVLHDYQKIDGWMSLLTRNMQVPQKEYDRTIGFSPIWWSNKGHMVKLDF